MEIANINIVNLAIAYEEVPMGSLPENQPVITADGKIVSVIEARRLCYRALRSCEGLSVKESDAGNVAVAETLDNPSRGQSGLVFVPNTSANRIALSSMREVRDGAYDAVLKGLTVDANGYLRTKTLASNRTLASAEKALRVLGFNVYGRDSGGYSVLVPTNNRDQAIAHDLLVRQMMKPTKMATYLIKEGLNGLVQTVARGKGLGLGGVSAVKDRQHTRS